MLKKYIEKLIRDYIKAHLDIFISRDGYNDELILVSITLDGEEIANDTVRVA